MVLIAFWTKIFGVISNSYFTSSLLLYNAWCIEYKIYNEVTAVTCVDFVFVHFLLKHLLETNRGLGAVLVMQVMRSPSPLLLEVHYTAYWGTNCLKLALNHFRGMHIVTGQIRCSCLPELVAISCNLPISWCLFVASFRTTVLSLSPSIAEGGAARATMMVATLSDAGPEMKDGLQLFKVL